MLERLSRFFLSNTDDVTAVVVAVGVVAVVSLPAPPVTVDWAIAPVVVGVVALETVPKVGVVELPETIVAGA
jgi:hypothetical protein